MRRGCLCFAYLFAAACSGKSASIEITVRGAVVSPTGLPVAGVLVSVAGASPVTTGIDGRFEFFAVRTPYVAVIAQPQWSRAIAFVGLTRSDPTLPFAPGPSWSRSGLVCGRASGGSNSPSVAWVFTETPSGSGSAVRNSTAAFCTGGAWNGSADAPATVHMIDSITRSVAAAGGSWVTTDFPAVGSTSVVLTDGATAQDALVTLAPAAASALNVSAALPTGWSALLAVDGFYGPSHFGALPLAFVFGDLAQPWPAIAVPALSGFRTHVWIWGYGPEGGTHVHRVLESPPSRLDLDVPLPPVLLAPESGAVDVALDTPFSWNNLEGGDLSMLFVQDDAGWSLKVYTNATSVVLPDLSAVGITVPRSAPLQWQVVGFGSTGGVEGLTTLAGAARAEIDQRAMSEDGEVGFVASPRALTFR